MATKFNGENQDPASRKARQWIVRIASGEMTESEAAQFRIWLNAHPLNRKAFQRERRFWKDLESLREIFQEGVSRRPLRSSPVAGPDRALAVSRKSGGLFARASATSRGKRFAVSGLIAASLAVFILWTQSGLVWFADHRTRTGEIRELLLPDGSVAHLNSASAVNVRFGKDERHIDLLHGEVFFDVQHNPSRPFRVTTAESVVEVLGTRFAVAQNKTGFAVTVLTGEVAVFTPPSGKAPIAENSGPVRLKAGQRVHYTPGSSDNRVRPVDMETALPWRQGKIIIDGLPFIRAIEELDQYHPGSVIVLGDISDAKPVSGVFSIDQIDSAIVALASTQGLTVSHLTDYLIVLR